MLPGGKTRTCPRNTDEQRHQQGKIGNRAVFPHDYWLTGTGALATGLATTGSGRGSGVGSTAGRTSARGTAPDRSRPVRRGRVAMSSRVAAARMSAWRTCGMMPRFFQPWTVVTGIVELGRHRTNTAEAVDDAFGNGAGGGRRGFGITVHDQLVAGARRSDCSGWLRRAAMTVRQGSSAASAATCLLRQSADLEVVISAKPEFRSQVPKVAAVRAEKNSTRLSYTRTAHRPRVRESFGGRRVVQSEAVHGDGRREQGIQIPRDLLCQTCSSRRDRPAFRPMQFGQQPRRRPAAPRMSVNPARRSCRLSASPRHRPAATASADRSAKTRTPLALVKASAR